MMQPDAPPQPTFSWKRALLHGLAVFVAFLVVTMIVAVIVSAGNEDAGKMGESAGRDACWAFLLALGASWGFQTGKKTLGLVLMSLVGVLLVLQVYLFLRIGRQAKDSAPLTAAEKERPAREKAEARLCQPALGFSLPDPGANFAPASALEQKVRSRSAGFKMEQWVWERTGGSDRLLVQAVKGVGDETSFRDFAAGLKKTIAANPSFAVKAENVRWAGGRGQIDYSAGFKDAVQIEMHCLTRESAGDLRPLAVCVQTIVREGDPLRDIRNGLTLAPCTVGS